MKGSIPHTLEGAEVRKFIRKAERQRTEEIKEIVKLVKSRLPGNLQSAREAIEICDTIMCRIDALDNS